MSLKSFSAKIFAKRIVKKNMQWINNPIAAQKSVFAKLMETAKNTKFGKDHNFASIKTHSDFVENVPVRDYEALKSYVELVVDGKENILWPGKPIYFAKTSGTTSGAKYIPITKESIKHQINASRDAILNYIHETGSANFVDGKMIFYREALSSPRKMELNWAGFQEFLRIMFQNIFKKTAYQAGKPTVLKIGKLK